MTGAIVLRTFTPVADVISALIAMSWISSQEDFRRPRFVWHGIVEILVIVNNNVVVIIIVIRCQIHFFESSCAIALLLLLLVLLSRSPSFHISPQFIFSEDCLVFVVVVDTTIMLPFSLETDELFQIPPSSAYC